MDVMLDLVNHCLKRSFQEIPKPAKEAAHKAILDTLGAIIAGSSEKALPPLLEQIREWGGIAESAIPVFGDRVPAHMAAFAGGTMARALEMADVFDGFPLHPSASLIPSALSASEKRKNVSGKEFLTAIALGQDLIVRFALTTRINPIESGRYNLFKIFPPTGVAGRLLGLNERQLANAMGIAFTQMVGDGQSAFEGAMTHYLQQGVVAQSSIECALLAQKGITGSTNVLEGPKGFFKAFEPEPKIEALTTDLGERFMGTEISIKLYSSCRATHQAIDLALELAYGYGLDVDAIERIDIRVNESVFNLTCLNRETCPDNEVDAQFSLPYCVAAALVNGDFFIDELKENTFRNPKVTSLAERVFPVIDPARQTDLIIGSTAMKIHMKDGRRYEKETSFPRGNPNNPINWDGCVEKFKKCVAYSAIPYTEERAEQIIDFVKNLETSTDISPLAGLLVADGG